MSFSFVIAVRIGVEPFTPKKKQQNLRIFLSMTMSCYSFFFFNQYIFFSNITRKKFEELMLVCTDFFRIICSGLRQNHIK